MPTYLSMLKWTSQGLQEIKQSPARLDAVRKAFGSLGITVKDFYMVTGQYDMIVVVEAPDDMSIAKALLAAGSQGRITSETCRAFTEDEYREIVAGLP
jgi:uncharacterized protein with GYD domain